MPRFVFRFAVVFFLASVAVFTGASGAVAEDGNVFRPTFEQTKCPTALPPGVRDGIDVRCGYVTVPELHAKPDGKTIQLAVAVIEPHSRASLADPVVFLDGGPGLSSLSSTLPLLAGPVGAPLRDTGRDLVLIEQRGNFHSKPALTCPEVTTALTKAADNDRNVEARRGTVVSAYEACRDRLKGRGINLSAYNGVENAADVPMVVQALGYDRYNVYGVSYGTQLAQHLLRDHPQGIRSLVLNSVMPMDVNVNAAIPASAQRAFDLLFEVCSRDSVCSIVFSGLRAEFDALVARHNAAPLRVDERTVTGDDLVRLLSEEFTSEGLSDLPRKIRTLAHGDTSWLATRLANSGGTGTEALGMLYSTVCAEDADFGRNDMELETQVERAMAAGRPAEMLAVCAIWGVDKLPRIVDYPVVSDVPAVLMAGEFDVITPPEFLPYAAAGLSKSFRFRFPATGHGGIDLCRFGMLLQFFDDPSKAPNSACIQGIGVQFSTAAPGITTLHAGLSQPIPPVLAP